MTEWPARMAMLLFFLFGRTVVVGGLDTEICCLCCNVGQGADE